MFIILLSKMFRPTLHVGVKAKVEFKSNIPIGSIIIINPKGLTLIVMAEKENIFFNLLFYGLDLGPKA